MEEQLISFETAKLAKEKGFNLVTINAFAPNWNSVGKYEEVNCYHWHEYGDTNPFDWNTKTTRHYTHFFSRPPQSLLQKWLREQMEIEIYVRPSFKTLDKYIVCYMKWRDDRKFRQQYFIIPLNDNSVPEGTHRDFNSYEEALEAGLYESLKLI